MASRKQQEAQSIAFMQAQAKAWKNAAEDRRKQREQAAERKRAQAGRAYARQRERGEYGKGPVAAPKPAPRVVSPVLTRPVALPKGVEAATVRARAREAREWKPKRSTLQKAIGLLFPASGNGPIKAGPAAATGSIPLASSAGIGRTFRNAGTVVASDPIKQTQRIPGDIAKSVIATPAALYGLARDPKEGAEQILADYKRRYGGTNAEQIARMKKDGVTAEGLDLLGAVGGVAIPAGRAAQTAAAAGRLGAKAERIATAPRPHLQVSAGRSVPQALSPNLLSNVRRKAQDKRRATALQRRVEKNGGEVKDLVDAEAAARGSVRPGNVPIVGKQRRAQIERKDLARLNSSNRVMHKGELQRGPLTLEKDIAQKLSKDEQRGLALAVKFGIKNAEQARRVLPAHIAQVLREREAALAKGKPVSLTKRTDQLPELQALLADADRIFTPRVRAVADDYNALSRQSGLQDPSLRGEDALRARAVKPLAELHGVTYRSGDSKTDIKKKRADATKAVEAARTVLDRAKVRSEQSATRLVHTSLLATEKTRLSANGSLQRAEADVLVATRALAAAKKTRKAITREKPESPAAFVARARKAIPEDLAEPGYFKSEKRNESPFGVFTRGSGKDPKAKDKQFTGALSRTGRESMDVSVLPRSIAKGISRRYNWEFIRENIRDGSPEWGRNRDRSELLDEAERRGLDPASFVLVRNKLIEKDARAAAKNDSGGSDITDDGDFGTQAAIHQSIRANSVPGEHARMDLSPNPGWTLMSKTRHKEMESNATPSGAASRSFQVAKGKVSRILLGTPGWLQFQVAANALLSGIAGTGPIDFVKAQRYFKQLEREHPERYAELQAMTGIEPWFDEQTRLGATANNRIVNSWRALKTTGLYHHALNPTTVPRRTLDVLFRADNAQNNAFRKAVLYSQVKREAYERMGASTRNIIRAQESIGPSLEALGQRAKHLRDLGPKERMAQVVKDQAAMEKHAEYVRDFLGDYMTYTARERRYVGRSVMFYGFLRFSLKFTMYTMPTRHPVMSAIMVQLGRMQVDELERIFGTKPPPWELANWYSEDGKKRMNIGRMIPFFNASSYFDFDTGAPNAGPAGYASLAPYYQIAGNWLMARDVAKDRPRTTGGDDYNFNGKMLTTGERNSVALAEAANVVPLFRLLKKTGIPGVRAPDRGAQSSESSLFNPVPRKYKRPDKIAENNLRKKEDAARSPGRDFFVPILPASGESVVRSSRAYAESQGKLGKKKKPAAKKPVGPTTGGWQIGTSSSSSKKSNTTGGWLIGG